MAYGTPSPKGLVAINSTNGSQTNEALAGGLGAITCYIKSGYATNIGMGDPVVAITENITNFPGTSQPGVIVSASDFGIKAGNLSRVSGVPIFGVFDGCYTNTDNEFYPDKPGGAPHWVGGTVTTDTLVPCRVRLATTQTLYTVQVGAQGALIGALWNYASFVFQLTDAGAVILNGSQSTGYLEVVNGTGLTFNPVLVVPNTAGQGASSFQITGFGDGNASYTNPQSQIGVPYGTVVVRIGNLPFSTITPTSYIIA